MAETLIAWFQETLGGKIPSELIVFIISMVPILELRGGMIAARLFGLPYLRAALICIVGNLIPIPFILWLITPIFNWMKTTGLFRPLVEKLEKTAMSKSDKVAKAEFIGLLLFVGIPIPGTGAWMGSLIAALLNIKFKKAIVAEVLGLLLALIIMSIITYVIPWLIAAV